MKQARQGDVMVRRIDALPEGATRCGRENGQVILAHGEATGHAHRIRDRRAAEMFEHGDRRYLVVDAATSIVHEEHDAIPLEAGVFEVIRQREYTPEEIRNVAD